jgi:hypothetical protein
MASLERDELFLGDVAPSFVIERRRRTPLQMVGKVIGLFNRRAEDRVQEDAPAPPRPYGPRIEPPLETLVRDIPNSPAGGTPAGNASR